MKSKYFPDHDRLAKPEVAAKIFQVCTARLANDRSHGRGLPYLKIGKSVVYDLDACYETAANAGNSPQATAAA